MKNYKIVADSSANLTELPESLFGETEIGFQSVPLKLHTTKKEYVDDETLDVGNMVAEMRASKGPLGSACPNGSQWCDAFGDGDEIFAFTMTSSLSGTYETARLAAEEYEAEHPGRRVHVFDSLSTGPEMELLIEKTVELIHKGKSFDEIVRAVEAYSKRTHLLFSLESLHNLAANGRVSQAVATIAGVLGIRLLAVASDEGTVEPLKKARGEKAMLRTMWEIMKERGFAGGKVRLAHCLNENAAKELAALIKEAFKNADVKIRACRGLCSLYAEKGGLLVGFEAAEA